MLSISSATLAELVFISTGFSGVIFLLSTVSFAEKEHSDADIKLLRDSAAALQISHTDLAGKLTKRADRNTKRLAEKK